MSYPAHPCLELMDRAVVQPCGRKLSVAGLIPRWIDLIRLGSDAVGIERLLGSAKSTEIKTAGGR